MSGLGGNNASEVLPGNGKGQLLLTAPGQSVPPSPSAKQDSKRSRTEESYFEGRLRDKRIFLV